MYLPNPAVRPSESDGVEFIDVPPMAHASDGDSRATDEVRARPTVQFSPQARIDVTRKVRDYITKLVANHGGGTEAVRLVIQDLQDQMRVQPQQTQRPS